MSHITQNKNFQLSLPTKQMVFSLLLISPLLFWGIVVFAGDLTPSAVLALTNVEREKQGLTPLTENKTLNKAAELKAAHMIQNDYFAHNSPTGVTPWHWMKEAGYKYRIAGENLAINFDAASDQETAWMKSKTHRENILNAEYTEMGVAVVKGEIKGKTSFITVVLFGAPPVAVATKNSDTSLFASLPMVKGAQTKMSVLDSRDILVSINNPIKIFQNIPAIFLRHEEVIFQNVDGIMRIILLLSLTVPAMLFVGLGFRELSALSRPVVIS